MMQNTAYRLAEYKIIENRHGDLWWEAHIGLGTLKTGRGFVNGDILFLVPSDLTGPGFLKGEFLDHINKLPKWKKTKYYCASYKISECQSVSQKPLIEGIDSRLKNEGNLQQHGSTQKALAKTSLKLDNTGTTAYISYKLGRYEITEMNHGQLVWKSPGRLGSLKMGRCHIRGSILFFEPGKTEQSGLKKKEFLQHLNQLPDWVRTQYFCASYAIYYSSTGAVCRRLGEENDLNRTGTQNVVVNRKAYKVGINIKPINADKGAAKDKLKAFLSFCKLLMILILKLLFAGSQIVYTISITFINRWKRPRG